MKDLLPFIIVGLSTGSIYAIAGMGLVLTYRTSGIFNFAHGAVAAVAAYVFYELHTRAWPWPIAALFAIVVVGVAGGFGLERLGRRLMSAPVSMAIVATVGLLLAIRGLAIVRYGAAARTFPRFLPQRSFTLFGVQVTGEQLIVMAVALASAVVLYLFFRLTRLGMTMRAVVDDPDLVALTGTSPVAVRRWAWGSGSMFAAGSGLLLAPAVALDATVLTLLVVQAFGAAAIGRFTSLPLTYVGGLVVGVAAAVSTKYAAQYPALRGLASSMPFIVLFAVLLFARRGRFPHRGESRIQTIAGSRLTLPVPVRRIVIGGGAVLLLLLPHLVGTRLPVYTAAVVYGILFLSLALLVRTSGQVSLCHAGFAALGASTFSHLTAGAGIPWPFALVAAGLLVVPLGALVAIPAIRLAGIYLALATFGFNLLLERMLYTTGMMFGAADQRIAIRPSLAAGDTGYFYVVLVVFSLAAALVLIVQRARLGRLLRALSDSPAALTSVGVNVNMTRVLVFCLSAFLAGISGALLGPLYSSIGSGPFSSIQSLLYLVILIICGPGTIRPALLAGAALMVIPAYISDPDVAAYLPVAFGASAVIAALVAGRPLFVRSLSRRVEERMGTSPVRARRTGTTVTASAVGVRAGTMGKGEDRCVL